MKKFYETPAVEFTGFDVEDIITTSGDPVVIDSTSTDPEAVAAVNAAVATLDAGANSGAATYGAYNW
jgi:hypothetical protein